jgi:putative PIG3 family NAD(P)H quinone oxidoreductase
MRAVFTENFNGPESLEIRDVAEPKEPAGNSVLVRVHAAGINRADLLQIKGLYPPPSGYSPNIPGLEFAGQIAAVGNTVKGWKVDDRVFGITAGEAQAEYVVSDTSLLARIPDQLSYPEAAAVPEVFITAHDSVFTLGELGSGQTLLIHAAGSGVGLAAMQLAKAKGANVIGTSRTAEKLERCKEFGLGHAIVIDGEPQFSEQVRNITDGRGVEVILDLAGAAYFTENLNSLAAKGRLILVGLVSGKTVKFDMGKVLQKRISIIGTSLRGRSTEEKSVATALFSQDVVPLLANETIQPNIDRVFTISDAREAYIYLESNRSFGKVILQF